MFCVAAYAEAADPIAIRVASSCTTCEVGDSIRLSIEVTSVERTKVSVGNSFFSSIPQSVVATRADGIRLRSLAELHSPFGRVNSVDVAADAPLRFDVDLQDLFVEPYAIDEPHTLEPGRYRVLYKGTGKVVGSGGAEWVGTIESNTIVIRVAGPDARREEALGAELQRTNLPPRQQWALVQKLAASAGSKRTDRLLAASELPDLQSRLFAVRQLGKPASEQNFNALEQLIQSPNPLVRAEAVLALSNYDTDAAYSLIVAECASGREQSYRAAIVALGRVGRPDAIPTLEKIEATDPEPWVRERARQSIDKITARGR